jgi:GT2 family glycosyltransferase
VAANDDILCINKKWWPGILEQFERYPEMMAVCPASVMEPGWGYGLNEDGWVPGNSCPDWGVAVGANIWPKKLDGTAMTKEESMTEEGYDFLLEHRKGHIEGFAGWFVVGKREMWENVGLYDERFVPGGAEDYQICHRIYLAGGRASATLGSFVWHEWTKSRRAMMEHPENFLQTNRHAFQDCNALFEHSPDGVNSPIFPPRDNELHGNKRKLRSNGIFIDDIR